jgi:hopanoid biosynthesis associated radical SAM protein HpnH
MRFPLALSAKIARHIIGNKLRGVERFALVLQLEPLHTCNLTCTGCGRIREYSTSLKDMMSLDDCLAAAAECDAPMVSVCGGEPLIYPKIEELVNGLLRQRRIVYICTNGVFLRKKLREYGDGKRPAITPSRRLYWNIHLDALERTHDMIVEREGVFREAVEGIKLAKSLGFQVATNATVYKETDMEEIQQMFDFLSALGVDGHTISPGYDYDAAKRDMIKRHGKNPDDFFLTRRLTTQKFSRAPEWGRKYPMLGSPVYLEFLAGKRDLHCTAWAIPTRNIAGWKAPCYLITDGHYKSYREMLEKVDWSKYGVFGGVARDHRCENCMTHCGYEPTPSLGIDTQPGDIWKIIKYNFGPRPKRIADASHVNAYNGVSSGNGHLTGKASIPA